MKFTSDFIALPIDMGCLTMIWLVQLVIYPSFQHLSKSSLPIWHEKYTQQVAYVVLPLMLGQLILTIMLVINTPTILYLLKFLLVAGTWLITFLVFVPLHKEIGKGLELAPNLKKLVHKNWIRTFVWSIIFLIQAIYTFSNIIS